MKLKKLIKKINKENAPPDGWKPGDKVPSSRVDSLQALGYNRIMKKEYYYLDKINFELIAQEKDKTINLNSSVLSDATLKKVLDDIEKNLRKTNKELM